MLKIELDTEFLYHLKDAVMVEFLKDDLDTVKQNLENVFHLADVEYDKELIKAYKTILKYYGVYND